MFCRNDTLKSSIIHSNQVIWMQITPATCTKRPWQTRTLCCGHKCFPFARARNICCGHKFCVRDTKNVSDFVQKHFEPATNVSQFAQHGNTTFILCPARLRAQETSWATMYPQQCIRNNVSSFARARCPVFHCCPLTLLLLTIWLTFESFSLIIFFLFFQRDFQI